MSQFNIRTDVQQIIHSGVLRKFAKDHNLEYSGTKNNLMNTIILAVRSNSLSENVVRKFIQEQLWYGRNKHTFYIEVTGDIVEQFRDTDCLLEYFNIRGTNPFNNIDRINLPDGPSLVRFEYETNPTDASIVDKVMLGYIEKAYTHRFETTTPLVKPENVYVCVELDLVNRLLILRVRSRSKLKATSDVNSANVSANYLAKKYLERLQDTFGFEYLDGISEEIKNTMFKIEKELTTFIELQFKPKVSAQSQLIQSFTQDIAERIGLVSNTDPLDLCERITGLLERALIVQNEDVIRSYDEGKLGYVNKFDFKDDRGGRINARSKHSSTPIQTSDIFFDTRETINEVQLLDTLSVVWFKSLDEEENRQYLLEMEDSDDDDDDDDDSLDADVKVLRIKTKIAAYKGFYKIEFKRYLLKEEYNHVLSLIERFRSV